MSHHNNASSVSLLMQAATKHPCPRYRVTHFPFLLMDQENLNFQQELFCSERQNLPQSKTENFRPLALLYPLLFFWTLNSEYGRSNDLTADRGCDGTLICTRFQCSTLPHNHLSQASSAGPSNCRVMSIGGTNGYSSTSPPEPC